ncbi:hypothetical protein [uncultured Jatrophihabitans sp.]|uniref:hypothetical protein n=1 Tax=uncultured Jatrophihabitans sp. TaxID=1610747 RepID=UPI0035CA75FB
MTSPRPFSASSSKLAYAQAFSRCDTAHPAVRGTRPHALRGIAARLHRTAKPTR